MKVGIAVDNSQDLKNLYDEAYDALSTDPRKTVECAGRLRELARAATQYRMVALSYYVEGFAQFNLGNFPGSIDSYQLGDSIASEQGYDDISVKFRNGFGVVYFDMGRIREAIAQYSAGIEAARRLDLPRDLGNLLVNLGIAYTESSRPGQALVFLEEARKIARTLQSDSFSIHVYFNYGEALRRLGRIGEAEASYLLSLTLATKTASLINKVEALMRVGELKAERGEREEGLAMVLEALAVCEASGYLQETLEAGLAAASILLDLGRHEEALDCALKTRDRSESGGVASFIPESCTLLARAQAALGQWKESAESLFKATDAMKLRYSSQSQKQMMELETVHRLETAKREARIERKQREDLEAANARLSLVASIGHRLTASLSLPDIVGRLWEGLSPAVELLALGVGVYDSECGILESPVWIEQGILVLPEEPSVQSSSSLCYRCASENKTLFYRSAGEWRTALGTDSPLILGNPDLLPETVLFVPLKKDERVIGVLALQSAAKDAYSEQTLEMVYTIGSFVSIAIDNASNLERLDELNRTIMGEKDEIARLAERSSWLAEHDALTGLPNRLLLDRLQETFAGKNPEGLRVAVIYFDLDGFKEINDQFGHDAGDRLLVKVARRLEKLLEPEELVARIGGDEFVLIMPMAGSGIMDTIQVRMERLMQGFLPAIRIAEGSIDIRVSAGVSVYPDDGREFRDLVRLADEAMYEVKRHSRNNWRLWSQTSRGMMKNDPGACLP